MFEEAEAQGYAIELHFVWIPSPQEAIQRVREGGHAVPADDIRRRFTRGIQHLLGDYAPLTSKWFFWDNSTPPARLLAESVSHSILRLRSFFASHEEKSV